MNLTDTVRAVLKQKGQDVWSVTPEVWVYDAIEMMADKHVGALLVTHEGKLVGIISERDYARKVILEGKSSKQTRVLEIMTSPAIRVAPERSVEECMRIMTDNHIRHLPVVENGEVYHLDDQQQAGKFLRKNVVVTGVLDQSTDTIHVRSIVEANT